MRHDLTGRGQQCGKLSPVRCKNSIGSISEVSGRKIGGRTCATDRMLPPSSRVTEGSPGLDPSLAAEKAAQATETPTCSFFIAVSTF